MLKIETNTKTSPESTPSISSLTKTDESSNEDKLSLLVKAAEKLVDDEKKSLLPQSETTPSPDSEQNNLSKITAFVNSLKDQSGVTTNYPIFIGKNGKPTRPFKAYPKESLSLPIGGQSTSFNIPNQNETKIINPNVPLNVNTNLSSSLSSSSTSSSCSNSPITVLNTNNANPSENKNVITSENLLTLLTTLLANQSGQAINLHNLLEEHKLVSLSTQIKSNDLTSLNLNDLTTLDISSLAFNPNDFCVQHRKRIQQAQERVLKKQLPVNDIITSSTASSPRRRNSSNGKRINSRTSSIDRLVINENQVDSTCTQNTVEIVTDEYMNYPPKKRHRIQLEQIKKNEQKISDEEPTSSNSSQNENKLETPVNSPSSTTKQIDTKTSHRSRQSSADDGDKDDAYRERRRKNNEAAKRSRDARRAKEDDIALRAALLERENLQLKVEIAQLKQETSRLRCLLYNS